MGVPAPHFGNPYCTHISEIVSVSFLGSCLILFSHAGAGIQTSTSLVCATSIILAVLKYVILNINPSGAVKTVCTLVTAG